MSESVWNVAEYEEKIKEILTNVAGENSWDDTGAGTWTKRAQVEIFNLIKKDGHKVVVLAEAISKGSGNVKQQYSLISKDDLVVQTQVQNSQGLTMYALAVVTKY